MPSVSRAQQRTAGMALAMKQGKMPMMKGPAKDMAASMTEKQLKEFASTPRKGLPGHAKKR